MKLSSILFRAYPLTDEALRAFKYDLDELLNADDKTLELVLNALKDPEAENNLGSVTSKISEELPISEPIIRNIFSAARYWIYACLKEEINADTVDQWIDDLISLEILNKNNADSMNIILNKIKNDIAPVAEQINLKTNAETGVLPYFKNISTSVELRAINKKPYSSNNEIDKYTPEIIGTVGLVSIRLQLDEAYQDVIHFQLGRSDLKRLTNKLTSALNDLDALERFMSRS